jgi:hypothetical protein
MPRIPNWLTIGLSISEKGSTFIPACSVVITAERVRIGPWLPAETVNFDMRLYDAISMWNDSIERVMSPTSPV